MPLIDVLFQILLPSEAGFLEWLNFLLSFWDFLNECRGDRASQVVCQLPEICTMPRCRRGDPEQRGLGLGSSLQSPWMEFVSGGTIWRKKRVTRQHLSLPKGELPVRKGHKEGSLI